MCCKGQTLSSREICVDCVHDSRWPLSKSSPFSYVSSRHEPALLALPLFSTRPLQLLSPQACLDIMPGTNSTASPSAAASKSLSVQPCTNLHRKPTWAQISFDDDFHLDLGAISTLAATSSSAQDSRPLGRCTSLGPLDPTNRRRRLA